MCIYACDTDPGRLPLQDVECGRRVDRQLQPHRQGEQQAVQHADALQGALRPVVDIPSGGGRWPGWLGEVVQRILLRHLGMRRHTHTHIHTHTRFQNVIWGKWPLIVVMVVVGCVWLRRSIKSKRARKHAAVHARRQRLVWRSKMPEEPQDEPRHGDAPQPGLGRRREIALWKWNLSKANLRA